MSQASTAGRNLLRGELVRLAGQHPEDAQILARWSEDAEYMRLVDSDWVRPHTVEECAATRATANFVEFRIRTLSEDKLIGFVAVHSIEWNNRVGEISIGIGDVTCWGQGYGTDALRVILGYAFQELNLDRIWLTVIASNARAIHTYEKVGFRHEGALRQAVYRDGQRYDMLVMGLLRAEWCAQPI
jgi:RimJ/RimL family protein N-acetyltransferase